MSDTLPELWHGTKQGYSYRKCRCDSCTSANTEYHRGYREANPERMRQYLRDYSAANVDKVRDWKRASRAANPERERARQRAWSQANPEKRRAGSLRKYGLTVHSFSALLAAQNGGCAICGTDDPGGRGQFHVDHDHTCCPGVRSCGKCIRGLLCALCNVAPGGFRDNPELLRQAIEYLNRKA